MHNMPHGTCVQDSVMNFHKQNFDAKIRGAIIILF